jgi:drug/metabolite transporter (DMT)-like permease
VARGYLPLLVFVAAIWGASYMFIRVAVDEIDPVPLMALRLLLASLVLLPILMIQRGGGRAFADLREAGWGLVVLGVINTALPFTLIAWGELHVNSSIAGIANAPVPIFVALLAIKFRPSERVTGMRLVGILVGFLGVGVLAGLHPEGGVWAAAGTLAVVLASLSYAAANLFTQSHYTGTAPLVLVTGSSLAGFLILAPIAVFRLPEETPSAQALLSVAMLGIVGTAFALLLFFRMLLAYGASRTALVTYLIPPFAVLYGVTILNEPLPLNAVLGLALILSGVALGSGLLKFTRARGSATAPQES